MISNTQNLLSVALFASTVLGHGYVQSPPARKPGPAMAAACGQQMFNNQNSDFYGNVQGELQVTNGQSDYNAAQCNVWQCKGYKFEDNTANVQTFTPGQVVPMIVEIRAPHTGNANVSIVDTASNSVIGSPLISWDNYASNSAPIQKDQTSFSVTIPSNLGGKCAKAGDCVLQWFWDARSIDQTYEACVDFALSGSGSGSSSSAPVATPTSPVAAAPTTSTPQTPAQGSGNNQQLPQSFTLDTFITWLQNKAGRNARRHVRDF